MQTPNTNQPYVNVKASSTHLSKKSKQGLSQGNEDNEKNEGRIYTKEGKNK